LFTLLGGDIIILRDVLGIIAAVVSIVVVFLKFLYDFSGTTSIIFDIIVLILWILFFVAAVVQDRKNK